MPRKDLTNLPFDKLTVTSCAGKDKHEHIQWACRCECGNEIVVRSGSLLSGHTRSCGCAKKDEKPTVSEAKKIHGLSRSAEYNIWRCIKSRCYNPKFRDYHYYGGRGIVMSDEWKESFEAFYRDMGPRPSQEHSVDREDNELGYSKENCRWATEEEQANNRRNNIYYEFDGEKRTLAQWCRELRIDYGKMHYLLGKGIPFEDAADSIIRGDKDIK